MKRFRKAQCPYCGRKVGFASAWLLKREGEYRCPKCKKCSNVRQDTLVYLIAAAAVLLSAIFFVIEILFVKNINLPGLILVFAPFLVFYLLCPLLVRLKRLEPRRRPPADLADTRHVELPQEAPAGQENRPLSMQNTIVMDSLFRR